MNRTPTIREEMEPSSDALSKEDLEDSKPTEPVDPDAVDVDDVEVELPVTQQLSASQMDRVVTARALHAYSAQDVAELTFDRGEILTVLSQGTDGWWQCTLNGKTGLVPSNYVQLL